MAERIMTQFNFSSTALEVIAGIDLTSKRTIVTGAGSGIGIETARAMAGAGAEVTLAVRNLDAGEMVAEDIRNTSGNESVLVRRLDLADRESVDAFVHAWEGALHILINNSGVMAIPELMRDAQGHEMQFATNFLGHFRLTYGLHDALKEANGARVVNVSSSGHLASPVVFDDIDYHFRAYDPQGAYGQSKTAEILMAIELSKRWGGEGIYANSLMPGAIDTNLQKYVGGVKAALELRKTPQQGAATSVLLATSPLLERVGGKYFADCNEAYLVDHRPTDTVENMTGVAPYALDPANASRLWDVGEQMIAG